MRRLILTTISLTLLIAAYYGYSLVWGKPLSIHHFADRVMLQRLIRQPELLTFLGVVENTPLDFHSDRLSDLSPEGMSSWLASARSNYETLQAYREDRLDLQEQLTLDFMEWGLGSEVAASEHPYHFNNILYNGPYPVNQTQGTHLEPLQLLDDMQQVVDLASSQRYLKRMAAIPDYIDSLIAAVEYRDTLGANPPQVVLERSIMQIFELVETAPESWSIHVSLMQAGNELQLEEKERQSLSERSLQLLSQHIIPAYARLEATLDEIMPRAPKAVGIWTLPNGDAYYEALLYSHASTGLQPDAIHALGLELVAGFRREMLVALEALGYVEGGIAERIGQMMDEPGALYEDSDAGRQQIIDDFTRIGRKLETATASAFGMRPASAVVVKRVPEYAEDAAAGAQYWPPSLDGSRPGRFMINLRTPATLERHGMVTLSAHEAIPGHHFQVALTQSLSDLPMARRNALLSSYGEGWALYTEQLVHELGLHDTRSEIGRLQSMLFRASRLVVDTGIHAMRWTREEAIDYMRENTGMPLGEVITEVERYIAMPGQACSYMLGMKSILAARNAAQARLGDAFRLPDFHDAVLANGPLPIEVLEQQIERALQ